MIVAILLFTVLGIFFIVFITFLFKGINLRDPYGEAGEYPFISVLLAARNEEDNIEDCLKALDNLDYPEDRIEILVGDDRSEDKTRQLILNFIKNNPKFRLIDVKWEWGLAKSKANALAWLADEAKGDYYFITDADIRVPQKWIKGLLSGFAEDTGLVSGISVVRGSTFFGIMQGLEWLYYMGMLRITDSFKSVTAIGNNMAVRSEAYWATGGYQNIESSVTEDYKLFQQVTKLGWKHKHLFNPQITGQSAPAPNLITLLQQRKRWLRGGLELPAWIWFLMVVHSLFVPTVLILLFLYPQIALSIILLRWILQSILLKLFGNHLKIPVKAWELILFEPYHYFSSLSMPVYYWLPFKLKWKNREI